jgi:hypothetical protein
MITVIDGLLDAANTNFYYRLSTMRLIFDKRLTKILLAINSQNILLILVSFYLNRLFKNMILDHITNLELSSLKFIILSEKRFGHHQ